MWAIWLHIIESNLHVELKLNFSLYLHGLDKLWIYAGKSHSGLQ